MTGKILILFTFLATCVLFLVSPAYVFADTDFNIRLKSDYKIDVSGSGHITHTFDVENLKTETYASSYLFTVSGTMPKNISASEDGIEQTVSEIINNQNTIIHINFKNKTLGKGKVKTFKLEYDTADIAQKTGEVWEIAIPKLAESERFNNYKISLSIPKDFGSLAYISPGFDHKQEEENSTIYFLSSINLKQTGVIAAFGKFQTYNFEINYHLKNELGKSNFVEIPIPPDTSMQRVYYQSINPQPENIYPDEDGNWIARYKLSNNNRSDVVIKGQVQIFSNPRKLLTFNPKNIIEYTKPQKYWESGDPEIQDLARNLKTPENIYNYVVNNLSYNQNRAKPYIERLGAKNILKQTDNAICSEFTDLFIAISRAAGIPAREINGFAYTQGSINEPLSLVADVLHSWPEYFDSDKNIWIPVDPTWGNTSKSDYFQAFDLKHFAFVIHGKSSENPKPPGSYKIDGSKEKDIIVEIGNLDATNESHLSLSMKIKRGIFLNKKLVTSVKNQSPTAVYKSTFDIYFDQSKKDTHFAEVIPPFSTYIFETQLPNSFLEKDLPQNFEVKFLNETLKIDSQKSKGIIIQLLMILVVVMILIITLLLKVFKIHLSFPEIFREREKG